MDSQDVLDVFDRAAETYEIAAFPFFTPFGEALVEFAGIGPDDHVLDVGCGAGAALAPAARRAASAVGIELSPAMAERARAAAPEAQVVVGDASSLDFAHHSFDVVLAAFVIFFMPDPTAALTGWRQVLSPAGRLALSTWAAADPRWSFEREIRRGFLSEIPQETLQELGAGIALLNRFDDADKVQEELRAAGFDPDPPLEHQIEFVFRDEDAWWEWNWSHGSRLFLEALPESAREGFRELVYLAMQPLRGDARFPRRYTALFTRAVPGAEVMANT
jgi:SAM-dependent methyltransferase